MATLNSEHLRTFLAIAEAGSVTGGAERIGRSQSATSLQVRLLEDVVGQALFHRHGRGIELTLAGEKLHPVARQVIASLDATLSELRGNGLKGKLRIGMPDGQTRSQLASIISSFSSQHPEVELEVHCALGDGFGPALRSGMLDLAIHEVAKPSGDDIVLKQSDLIWVGSKHREFSNAGSLPVAVFSRDCWWRDAALGSLQKAGIEFHVVFSSESVIGVRAAVEAGIAVGLLSDTEQRALLQRIEGLDQRVPSYLVLQRASGAKGPICEAMMHAVQASFEHQT